MYELHLTGRRRRKPMNKRRTVAVILGALILGIAAMALANLAFAAGGTKVVEYSFSDPSGIDAVELQACCDGDVQPVSRVEYNGEITVEAKCSVVWQNYGSVSVKVRAIDNSPAHNATPWGELVADIPDNEAPVVNYVQWAQ